MPMPPNTQMPVANQAAADRASTASAARMQATAAMSAGQAMMSGPAVAQQAAGGQAQEQGQIAAQAQGATIQKSVGQAQQELHQTEIQNKERQIIHAEAMATRHSTQANKLNALGRDVKQKLLDNVMQFQEMNRQQKFIDQRNLEDFLTSKEVDKQTMLDYKQAVQASIDQEIEMMNHALITLTQAMQSDFMTAEFEKDEQLKQRVAMAAKAAKARLAKAKAKAGKFKKEMGFMKMAAGTAIIVGSGGTATGAGAGLIASGAGDAEIIGGDSKSQSATKGIVQGTAKAVYE